MRFDMKIQRDFYEDGYTILKWDRINSMSHMRISDIELLPSATTSLMDSNAMAK